MILHFFPRAIEQIFRFLSFRLVSLLFYRLLLSLQFRFVHLRFLVFLSL